MLLEYKSLQYKGKVIFEKMIMANFNRAPKPFSDNEACFIYLQEGSLQFRTPDKILKLSTGDAILAKCSNYFFEQTKTDQEKNTQSKGVGAYLHPEIVKELFDYDLSLSDFTTNYDATHVNIDQLMRNFIDGIDFLLDNPTISNDSMIKVKLKEFLLLLSNTENAPSILDFVSSLFKPYEYNFKNIVEKNTFASLTIAEIASLCGMSISTFQRTFNKVFGQTPTSYFLEKRMAHAKTLLRNKNLRISEIAYDCGYSSTSTFNRQFKSFFHISPSKYRLNESERNLN